LFPPQYTDRLAFLTDSTDPMDAKLVRRIVAQELCGATGSSSRSGSGSESSEEVAEGSAGSGSSSGESGSSAGGGLDDLSSVFSEWDDEPLGAATVAQVHRARLVPELGGREVAVKVQRPSIEQKLLGDVANIKVGG
jgi:aarF domain-containing kinase